MAPSPSLVAASGRSPVRTILQALPPGTMAVGLGLAVLGVASYVHLAVAGHKLGAAGLSSISVMWALLFSVGIGLFMPIEQEVSRIVAARAVAGGGVGPVLQTASALTGGMLALLLTILGLASGPIADRLFEGSRGMVLALCAALTGLAASYLTRGVLSGLGHFRWYGVQLALDGGIRMAMVGVLGVAGVRSPLAFALVLAVAPLAAVALTLLPVARCPRSGPPVSATTFCRGVGLLLASGLLSQVVVNIGVITVRLLEPEETAAAGSFMSAFVLARVPLFVFASLQASLLPALSRAVAAGDPRAYRRLLVRGLAVVTALGLGGGIPAVVFGPWSARILFDEAADLLGTADFAWLAAGTLMYMAAMVVGQAVVARGRHWIQTIGWAAGTVVLGLVTFSPGDVLLRAEMAFAAGSLAVFGFIVFFAWSGHHRLSSG